MVIDSSETKTTCFEALVSNISCPDIGKYLPLNPMTCEFFCGGMPCAIGLMTAFGGAYTNNVPAVLVGGALICLGLCLSPVGEKIGGYFDRQSDRSDTQKNISKTI